MIEILHSKLSKGQERYILGGAARSKYLGSGATAEVGTYGRKRVVRTQKTCDDYEAERVIPWIKLCLSSKSKHLPKIDFAAIIRDEYGDVEKVITVLERLEEIDTVEAIADDDVYVVDRFLDGRHVKWTEMTPEARKRFPKTAAIALRKRVKAADVYFNDMHSGNWMVRKSDGRLVITDPIA